MHWADRYLGRAYVPGVYECTDFVTEVLEREFGRELRLPRVAGERARARAIQALTGEFAVPVDAPREGDGVLMRVRGCRRSGYHLGVWIDRGPSVLHCTEALGAVLHPVRVLPERDFDLIGHYRWI